MAAIETAGRDPKFSINDQVAMTVKENGSLKTYVGQVTHAAYGTAQQVSLLWKGSLARNAGELGSRFFYRVRGEGFDPRRAYREESLEPIVDG